MIWVLLALGAHAGNAVVFAVDKALLTAGTRISRPVKYAFLSAVMAGLAVIVFPWVRSWPTVFLLEWAVLAGVFRIGALWCFFAALKEGEPSRVVPVAGSIVPLATLVLAAVFLGETLAASQAAAVLFLIAGGAFLSVKITAGGLSARVIGLTVLAGILFAANSVVMKFAYDASDSFLAAFMYSRLMEAAAAAVLLGPLMLRMPKEKKKKVKPRKSQITGAVFVSNKALAAGAFLLQSYAIDLGSVSVVNALQGTQYVFLLALAWAVSRYRPKWFREEMGRVSLWQKVAGIGLVVLGLVLLV